ATRAVLTGRVMVSDLSKLLVFKSAFRFKKAYYEVQPFSDPLSLHAYKNGLRAQQSERAPLGDITSRLLASPPPPSLLAELASLDDKPLEEALLFALYSYTGSEWTGDVIFLAGEGKAAACLTFSLGGAGAKLSCATGKPTRPHLHVVSCEKQVLVDVLTGKFEVTAAIMSGQMATDDFTSMMAFKRAFKFERASYAEFVAFRQRTPEITHPQHTAGDTAGTNVPTGADEAAGAGGADKTETEGSGIAATAAGEESGDGGGGGEASGGDGDCGGGGVRALSEEELGQLEGLADDPELQLATSFLFHAFEQSSMEIRLLCHLSHGESTRELSICVTPDGVTVIAAACEGPTCVVSCSREVLMQIIRGEVEASSAIVGGLVVVDDIAQIMCFKMAFKLERAAFDAYLSSRPELTR
ncbi:MAG: hypothetical protein SGPRY_012867, partial [Prymnesium sp.]